MILRKQQLSGFILRNRNSQSKTQGRAETAKDREKVKSQARNQILDRLVN